MPERTPMKLTASGLAVDGDGPTQQLVRFIDTVLRGLGQVMLQDNSYAGLLFLIGIFYNSMIFGLGVLVGTVISTATAMRLAVDRSRIRAGMFGFNGALVATALLYFLRPDALTWGCVVLAAACTTIVMASMLRLMQRWSIPVLTAPFVLITLGFLLARACSGRPQTHVLPTAGVVSTATVIEGVFNGVAQVFFQDNRITGVIFALALLVSARVACVAALAGSLTGLLVAWGMGAAEPAIRSGAFGFNAALAAIALGGVFFVVDRVSIAYALLAAVAATVLFAAMSAALKPIGIPPLTFPFVLAVWGFVLAGPLVPQLRTVAR
jgi:urea transporter